MPFLIFVSLIWGFSFVIIKGSLTSLDSNFVSFARLILSLLVFIPFVRPAGLRPYDILRLMLIGSIQFGLMYITVIAAYQDLPAYAIAILTTTTPIFVSITSGLYEKRFRGYSLLLALLAVAGGVILELPDRSFAANIRGIILLQISNAAFAFGQIAYRRWMKSNPALQDRNIFVFLYAGGALVAGMFSFFTTEYGRLTIQPHQWIALLYLGIVASGIGFFLWNVGARNVNEGILAIMNNMKIPVGVAASLVLLREKADWMRFVTGCALILLALYLNERDATWNSEKNSA